MLDRNKGFYREVGKKIKERREERGLKQEELASKVYLTRTSITNIEKGRQQFLLHTLVEIARGLGTEPSSLLPPASGELEAILEGLPPEEKTWIKTTVASPEMERNV